MAGILPLPPDAVSQISSSKHITSLNGAVLSLLENSLDAGATKVEISLDCRRGGCTIEDNGVGIPITEFLEQGGLGKMYHTSKHESSAVAHALHGTSGTYLASLAALSFMSITSRNVDTEESATLVIHQGKALARRIPSTLGQDLAPSVLHGTRVAVRDLFGNMPVRVKQRALAMERTTDPEKTWHELKRGVAALLLAWHRPCSVRLQDEESGRNSLQLSAQHPTINNALTTKSLYNLAHPTTSFDLEDALPILTQAGLAPVEYRSKWIYVSASTSKLSVKGAINLHPIPTKQCQFISIDIHPCNTGTSLNGLYEAVNKVFTNSSFGSVEDASVLDMDEAEKDRRNRDRRFKNDGYTQKQLHGRKGVDRWPMFVLQAKFTDDQRRRVSAENVNDGNLISIVKILEVVARQWLEAQHFRPRKMWRRKNQEQAGPAGISSPLRASSSGAQTPTKLPVQSATPVLKRPATATSASKSKKRKFLDITGKSERIEDIRPATVPARDTHFNTWSRIKSGRQEFYETALDGKRHPTASSERPTLAEPAPETAKMKFHLLSLEAGALGKNSRAPGTGATTTCSYLAADAVPLARNGSEGSSDDYGSVDDEAFAAAAVAVNETHYGLDNLHEGSDTGADETVEWADPVTKQVFHVNSRTGVVLPAQWKTPPHGTNDESAFGDLSRRSAAINASLSSTGRLLSLSRRPRTASNDDGTSWLPGFLKDWNNPVFSRQYEDPIPVTSIDGLSMDAAGFVEKECRTDKYNKTFSGVGSTGTVKLSKSMLRGAKIVRQVDRKFILCKMSNYEERKDGEMLVLVDQHAASERVILEQLLTDLCTPGSEPTTGGKSIAKTTTLEKPLRFEVSVADHELLRTHAPRLLAWGIDYDLSTSHGTRTAPQVRPSKQEHVLTVKSLPPAIAERCVQFPHLIIDLLRSEIWEPTSNLFATTVAADAPADATNDGSTHWLRRISFCPKGIIEMLNSRACRSAIMFNDELSVQECEDLLTALAECVFPFVCAHGRVGMAPVADLGGEGGVFGAGDRDDEGSEAFAIWLARRNK